MQCVPALCTTMSQSWHTALSIMKAELLTLRWYASEPIPQKSSKCLIGRLVNDYRIISHWKILVCCCCDVVSGKWCVLVSRASRRYRAALSHIALAPSCAVTASSRTCKYCRRALAAHDPASRRQLPLPTRVCCLARLSQALRVASYCCASNILLVPCSLVPTRWIKFTFWVSPIYHCGRCSQT